MIDPRLLHSHVFVAMLSMKRLNGFPLRKNETRFTSSLSRWVKFYFLSSCTQSDPSR